MCPPHRHGLLSLSMPNLTEVRTFLRSLDMDRKNAVSAEDLLRVLRNNVEGATLEDMQIFIKSITGKSDALLTEKDLCMFLEEMGF